MTVINGESLAKEKQMILEEKVQQLEEKTGVIPGLVVIVVGRDPASQIYARNKERAALRVGFRSYTVHLPEDISQVELLKWIKIYNKDRNFHGILVQLPLPKHIDQQEILWGIDPEKDVDGLHPINIGRLWSGNPFMVPCTPSGIMEMLFSCDVNLEGKHAVIVGRSDIVGKPLVQLLLKENVTVTLAHSRTRNLSQITKRADILIAAVGSKNFVTREFVRRGAIVIDVGMNRDNGGKLVGDVKFDEVVEIAGLVTPVPGGVGPMTIAMLLEQTYKSACRSSV